METLLVMCLDPRLFENFLVFFCFGVWAANQRLKGSWRGDDPVTDLNHLPRGP